MNEEQDDHVFTVSVANADGPTQLLFCGPVHGKRLLGSKGSPYRKTIHEWKLTRADAKRLIADLQEIVRYVKPKRKRKV